MSDDRHRDAGAYDDEPAPSILKIAHVVYGLHSLAVVIGISGPVTVIGSFLFGIPSIVAVVMNYLWRRDARGTFVESHFRWQIRTFWFTLLWVFICWLFAITFVGIPIALLGAGLTTVWVIYRVARGWLRLRDGLPMYGDE
jgi:uncharacterized membrane protein